MDDDYFSSDPVQNLKEAVQDWIEESWSDTDFITPGTEPHIVVEEID
jgi:hypothetical protein